MANMDDVIRRMMEEQYTAPDLSQSLQLQQGLLGTTPASAQPSTPINANSSAENILSSVQSQNQQATQQMANLGQQAVQQGIQASQGLQNQRQAEMNSTAQQASQMMQQEASKEQQQGQIFGTLLKMYLTGGIG